MANRIDFQVGLTVDKSGLTQMQSLLQQIANKAKEPGAQLNSGLQQAAATANTLDQILEKTFNTNLGTLNVTKFNQELNKSGLTLKQVQTDLSKVGNQGATAYNRLAQAILGTNMQLKQSSKLLDDMADTFTKTVKWGIASSLFNNMTSAIQKAYSYSKQLDTSLNDIRIVTDKSADNMDRFAEKANQAAKQMGASTLDYTNAALIYYQQGLSDEETAARAETTVKAANVTGQTGEAVSEQLTAVWNGYKVTAEETELYVDKLAAVAATTAADLEELSLGMSKVASAANAMGVDFDDLNAQIATIVSVTRQAPESVGTALKTIYARLGDLKVDGVDEFGVKLGEVSAQMETMGIKILDTNGDMRDMTSVMTEVAEKWNTWTRAQQQAAAVAMAGKRQYNNLVALFENWDMYSDALETSANAMGTLQHQQDIYMESTEAKLKTLKATWQDLYKGIIRQDELNEGIEALTNLVQVFDNFFDSFGGGIKSITAFGSIIANIFNKQIINGINNAIQRQEIFKQNLVLAETSNQIRQQGAMQAGDDARAQAIEANTAKQIEYSKQIYDARIGLNQEQANTLINYQKEIGALEEEIVLLEKQTQQTALTKAENLKVSEVLEYDVNELEDLNNKYGTLEISQDRILKKVKQQASEVEKILDEENDREIILSKIEQYERIIDKTKLDDLKSEQDIEKLKEKILNLTDSSVAKEKQELDTIKKEEKILDNVSNIRERINNKKEQQNNVDQEVQSMLNAAKSSEHVAQTVTTVTSSLSSMAMAWSSINSLIQTFNDETISIGDKITQTFMTLGMSIPMVISSFSKLNEVFGYTTGLFETFSVIKEKNTILTNLEVVSNKKLTASKTEEVLIEKAIGFIKNKNNITEEEKLILQKLENSSLKENITLLTGLSAAELKDIGFKEAEIAAILKLKTAQDALNKSMLMSPVFWVVAGLTALATVTALVIKQQQEQLQKQIDLNNTEIDKINKIQEEIDANKELYDEYQNLYSQYQKNEVEKEALFETTDKLCEIYHLEGGYLAKLTGNYTELTKAIKDAREAELKTAIEQSNKEKRKASENVLNIGRQGTGHLQGGRYIASLAADSGHQANADANAILARYGFGAGIIDIDANNTQALIDTYDQLQAAQAQMLSTMGPVEVATSQTYQNITDWLEKMAPAVEEYKSAIDDVQKYTVQLAANRVDLNNVTSLDEYEKKLNQFKEELEKSSDIDSSKIDEIVDNYLKETDNKFSELVLGIEELKKQVDDKADDYINSLTEGQKEYLLSGKVDLSFVYTKEDIEKALQKSFENYGTFDVTSPVSLATTLAKGTKLKKDDKQVLEALGEENTANMAGFDDQSVLHQLETIDEITQYRINKNAEYLRNTEDSIKEEIERRKNAQKSLFESEKEFQEAERKLKYDSSLSHEEHEALQEKINDYKQLGITVNDLRNKLDEGLSFDEIEGIGFESLISGIEMVTNKADALKTAAELIGEGFTVAASDVEKLSDIFPELLENYTLLADGSIKLDQDIVKQNIEGIQAEMDARTQAKIAEIDQQIALKELDQQYLQEKLKNLELYLKGEQTEQETVDAINKAGQEYASGLMEIIGKDNEALAQLTINNAELEGTTLINMLDQVGKGYTAAAKAHYAMIMGDDPGEWSPLSFGSSATSVQSYASSAGEAAEALYQSNIKQYEEIYTQAQEVASQLSTVSGELDTLKKQRAILDATGKSASHALDNISKGKAGKDSKSKSGGKNKDKDEKKLDEEFDRYWDIKKAIEAVEKELSKLDKKQEKLYGKELIKSLKLENQLLEQQAADYEALAAAQREEVTELQGILSGYGVAFDASGAITNYAAATAEALRQYNEAIQRYNAGLIEESALKVYEKNYEAFKKALERYDNLYYKEMQETQEKLEDIRRKQLENNLKAWEVEIQLKLDMKDLERQWNDFITEVTKDFQKIYNDLRVDLKSMLKDAQSYIGEEGTIGTIINAVHDVTGEIDKMRGGGSSNMFESISQAQEKLKELNDQLLDSATALHDLWEEAWDNYIDGIDQTADKFDDLIDRFEKINDELEFQKELVELLYGEEAFGLMSKVFAGQQHNMEEQLKSLKQQKDMWEDLFYASGATLENQTEWTEDQQKYYEEWMDAQSDLNDLVINYIKLLKEDYLNTVKDVLKQFENMVTSGKGLDYMTEQWDRISDRADKYYDSVEGAYEIQKLANKIDEGIASTKNLKNQQKLQEFRDREIQYLREKENLTKYDLDAAEARYEIMVKEAALEDARNNKTSMKLTRNAQGNWSYQYVADEEDIITKRQELLDAYNQLYQLASDAYESNLEALLNLQQTYLDKAQEIYESEVLSEEQKQERLYELRKWYLEEYKLLSEENSLYRDELNIASSALLLEIYEQDRDAYETMIDIERDLLDSLIDAHVTGFMDLEDKVKDNYNNIGDKAKEVMSDTRADWTSGAQTIADLWNKDSGYSVKLQVTQAYNAIERANQSYKDKVDWCADAVERDFSEEGISGAIMQAENETDKLKDKTTEMVVTSIAYLNELKAYVDMIADAWRAVQQAIMDAIGLIQQYLRYVGDINAAAAQSIASAGAGSGSSSSGSSSSGSKSASGGSGTKVRDTSFYSYSGGGGDKAYEDYIKNRYGVGFASSTFATGGYTGSWNGQDGKLAVLHQKEIVLNEQDTTNFLKGINTLRDMSGANGIETAVMKSVAGMVYNLSGIKPGTVQGGSTTTNDTSNVFNITAEFPNANDVNEIREAILTLPNLASQMINSNRI